MRLTKGRVAIIVVILLVGIGAAIFSRAKTVSSVCSSQKEITQTINMHDVALKEFIDANVRARRHTGDLALHEGNVGEATLQYSIANEYREIGDRFTPLPDPTR